jgi:small subunit ribosomal protein S1
VKVGEELEVRILRIDPAERKIGLSRKSAAEIQAMEAKEQKDGGGAAQAPKARTELKGGTEGSAGPLFTLGGGAEAEGSAE